MLNGITASETLTLEKSGKALKSIKPAEAPAKMAAPVKKEASKTL